MGDESFYHVGVSEVGDLAAKKIDVDELSHCATAGTSVANQELDGESHGVI